MNETSQSEIATSHLQLVQRLLNIRALVSFPAAEENEILCLSLRNVCVFFFGCSIARRLRFVLSLFPSLRVENVRSAAFGLLVDEPQPVARRVGGSGAKAKANLRCLFSQ